MSGEAQPAFRIRPIDRSDNPAVAAVIRAVMPEFGASGPGFAMSDPEVDHMANAYSKPRSAYFVIQNEDRILGGGGVAPLAGGDEDVCELRKMYFVSEIRGLGLGQALMNRCLEAARAFGFKRCYLETVAPMTAARALYERNGFKLLDKPMGTTGHFGCDCWMILDL